MSAIDLTVFYQQAKEYFLGENLGTNGTQDLRNYFLLYAFEYLILLH